MCLLRSISLLPLLSTQYTVHVKKNETNVERWHLKKWRQLCHFLPPKCRTLTAKSATLKWPHRSALSCKAKDCGVGTFCCENAARSPNCGTFGKNRGVFGKKGATIAYPGASCTNHKNVAQFHKSAVRKSGAQIFTNCCIFFMCTIYSRSNWSAFGRMTLQIV